jgi:hypothetical protein
MYNCYGLSKLDEHPTGDPLHPTTLGAPHFLACPDSDFFVHKVKKLKEIIFKNFNFL